MNIPEKLVERYTWFKLHSVSEVSSAGAAFEIISRDKNGLLSEITAKIHALDGNVTNFQSWIEYDGKCHITMQIDNQSSHDSIIRSLKDIPEVESVSTTTTNIKTWGKRIIIIGGGAQVASVASGAIAEADRHNIRGETISVDTIAVVGEKEIADSISAVGKLQRVGMLILAGSLMGGKITAAVNNLRSEYGIPVIALNMAGSVTKACDLVVTDPIEAGVMSVMLISHIGKFNLLKVHGKKY
jgi:energy-converting hydrogenase B subunit Q